MNNNTEEKKDNKKKLIIILLVILIAIASVIAFFVITDEDKTAIITDTESELQAPDETGKIAIEMQPYVNIEHDTMQNLNFENKNKDRLMKLKIKVGDKYVYESQFLEEGQMIQADVIDTSSLKKGENEAVAEVYAYTLDEEQTNQTNVKFILNYR